MTDGVEVRIQGRVDFYPASGRLQLVMSAIDPVFTVGKLAADRERVLRTLAAEGVLRRNGELELAMVPLRIGLVTSGGVPRTATSCTGWRSRAMPSASRTSTYGYKAPAHLGGSPGRSAAWVGSTSMWS